MCSAKLCITLQSEIICRGTQAQVWGEDFIGLHQPLCVCVRESERVYGSLAHPNEEGRNSRNATLSLKWERQAREQGNDGARGKDWKKTSSSCYQWLKPLTPQPLINDPNTVIVPQSDLIGVMTADVALIIRNVSWAPTQHRLHSV